jgi:hypothetical protein
MPAAHRASPALLLAAIAASAPVCSAAPSDLLTAAESSDWRRTMTSAEVVDLLERIHAASRVTHLAELGRSFEGRPIPLIVLANPPARSAAEARASGKPIVFAFGNIHAGEVCGKEALVMLAREIGLDLADGAEARALLDRLVVVFAPNYNPDGNDRMSPDNRPGQDGPAEGMGQRANAMGLDLNRDWVKLESPEAQAMVRFLTEWDPHLTIDTHTTNGSRHRYVLTYDAPLNPSGHEPSIAFVRDELLPMVGERLRDRTGYDTFFYGDFDEAHATWTTYSAQPRFGGPYQGLRGQMSILSEAYSYAPYRDRVLATREFVREILTYAAQHAPRLVELKERARREVAAAGADPQPSDVVGIRHRLAAWPEPALVRGYELAPDESGRLRPTDRPRDHLVVHRGRFEAALSVRLPHAYLVGPALSAVIERVRQHGIETRPFEGEARVERYTVTSSQRAERPFQGHHLVQLEVRADDAIVRGGPGWVLVPTAQPLGTLAAYLLEPQAEDGFAAWNLYDDFAEAGRVVPVYRVARPHDLRPERHSDE